MIYQGVLQRGIGPTANKIVARQSMGGLRDNGGSPLEFLFSIATPSGVSGTFNPVIELHAGYTIGVNATIAWSLGETVQSDTLTPSFEYTEASEIKLEVTPWGALKTLNAGYDHADGGSELIPDTPAQNISAIQGLQLAHALKTICLSYSPITNGTIFANTTLTTIEAYNAGLTSCSAPATVERLCVEGCKIVGTLNLSRCTALKDLRAALNLYSTLTLPPAADDLWHICIRNNDNLSMADPDFSVYPSLRDLLIWDIHGSGTITLPDSLVNLIGYNNGFTDVVFSGGALTQFNLDNNALSASDSIVNVLAAQALASGILYIANGTNADVTPASATALAWLGSNGWTVEVNVPAPAYDFYDNFESATRPDGVTITDVGSKITIPSTEQVAIDAGSMKQDYNTGVTDEYRLALASGSYRAGFAYRSSAYTGSDYDNRIYASGSSGLEDIRISDCRVGSTRTLKLFIYGSVTEVTIAGGTWYGIGIIYNEGGTVQIVVYNSSGGVIQTVNGSNSNTGVDHLSIGAIADLTPGEYSVYYDELCLDYGTGFTDQINVFA